MSRLMDRFPDSVRAAGSRWGRVALAAIVAAHVVCSRGATTPSAFSPAGEGLYYPAALSSRPFSAGLSTVAVSAPSTSPAGFHLADDALAVAAKVQSTLSAVRDVEQRVRMEIINPVNGHVQRAAGRLRAKLPNLFRIDFDEPDMLAGVAVVVDVARNQAWQYQPVTEQIIVQAWDQLARERGVEFELNTWLGFPDPERFHLKIGDGVRIDGTAYIVLEGRPRQPSSAARYEFLIHPERWWVEGLRLYDASDNLVFSAFIDNVTINQGLDEDRLRTFPAGADTIYR